jgi:hypothetical protein
MAVGLPLKTTYADGDVYSASDVNDTNGTVNLVGQTQNFYAGKNKIINSDFGIWQRGTSFTTSTAYTADRWQAYSDASFTASQQTFTAGTAPVSGYEGTFFYRFAKSSGGTYLTAGQKVEDVRTFAGQTVTLSFWARTSSGTASCAPYISQQFGSGGSGSVDQILTGQTVTTSWVRYSYTFTLASISGKTIGTSSYIEIDPLRVVTSSALTIDIWGVQLEAGSTATAFQTATGTIQGELAVCQRYYYRFTSDGTYDIASFGNDAEATTQGTAHIKFPVTMRITPPVVDTGGTWYYSQYAGVAVTLTSIAWRDNTSKDVGCLVVQAASGLSTSVKYTLLTNNSTASFIGFSAEL